MTTDLAPFASDVFTMRYRQPFVTAGLNEKHAVVIPPGIYQGFGLDEDPSSGERTVLLTADADAGDMVAVYQTETGYSLTIRYTGGDFLLDLSSYSNETVVLTIYATYALGADTTAVVRAYTETEYDGATEKDELVVIGEVAVPTSGQIDSSMITYGRRTMAWAQRAPETFVWAPLHENASFEISDAVLPNGTYAYPAFPWLIEGGGSNTMQPSETDPHSGYKCMEITYVSGTANWILTQPLGVPVTEGQRFRIRLYKKMVQAASSGDVLVVVYFLDKDGSYVAPAATTTYLSTAADAVYEEFDRTFAVPSGLDIVEILGVWFATNLIDFSTPGPAIRIDDFQVWLQVYVDDPYPFRDARGVQSVMSILLADLNNPDFDELGEQPFLRTYQGNVQIRRLDAKSGSSLDPVGMELFGQLLNIGKNLRNSSAQALTARFTTPKASSGSYTRTLLWEIADDLGGSQTVRIYADGYVGPGWSVAINARWTGTVWARDAAAGAGILRFTRDGGLEYLVKASPAPTTWTEASWDRLAFKLSSGSVGSNIVGLQYTDFKGYVKLGAELRGTDANARIARIQLDAADHSTTGVDPQRTLIAECAAPSATQAATRFYHYNGSTDDYFEITVNAEWSGTNWDKDKAAENASRFVFRGEGIYLYGRSLGAGTWDDTVGVSGWDTYHHQIPTAFGEWYIDDAVWRIHNTTTGTNPAHTTTVAGNALYASAIVKVWGYVQTDGSGGITTSEGLNYTAIVNAGTGELDINVLQNLASANYAVVFGYTWVSGQVAVPLVTNQTSSTFSIRVYLVSGSWVDLRSVSREIHFVVLAKQIT